VGCVQALEAVNKSRSFLWRIIHPFKNYDEKRSSEQMKRAFVERTQSGEEAYGEIEAAAYSTFDGHRTANASIEENIVRAREEMSRRQKMNEVIIESFCIEGF
jgi:hypothetical protein